MVFKTLMRLLQNGLSAQWQYEATGDDTRWPHVQGMQLDLWVLTPQIWQDWQQARTLPSDRRRLLVVGHVPLDLGILALSKPLNSQKLKQAIQQIEDDLLRHSASAQLQAPSTPPVNSGSSWLDEPMRRFKTVEHFGSAEPSVLPPIADTSVAAAPPASQNPHTAISMQGIYRLTRWPKAQFLTSSAHLRIATSLTGRALSLRELVILSRQEESVCRNFLQAMQNLGLLHSTSLVDAAKINNTASQTLNAPPPTPAQARKGSLLSMIRQKLGL